MIKPTYNRIGTRDLTGGISDALTNTYNMLNANDQQRTAEARQAAADLQNKQLFDLKMQEVDRANKDREAQIQFGKGMLQPGVMDNLLTDAISPELTKGMSFTQAEMDDYEQAKGDISKLKMASTKAKAEQQHKLGEFVYTLPNTPEYQETAYEQAKRIASDMELTPAVLEELKKYQVADITAQKEAKKEAATYAAEAKELETQIAKLRTKQGSIYDDAAGVGKEWGKNGSGDTNKVNSANILKYAEMVKNTDSAEELQGMIQEVFMNPGIPNNQKEAIAANIVISSGAKLPQGLLDFRNLNVSVEDAQKATTQYLENLKSGAYGGGAYGSGSASPIEVKGIDNEIALLEARRAGALAKANAYSVDRSTAAKNSVKARIDELFGRKPAVSSGVKSEQPTVRNNTSKTDKDTEKPENVNMQEPDVKTLFENVKTAKEKEKAYKDINKLAELYTSLGGTGGSAGVVDDLRIKNEAEALSKELKVPADEIIESMKSQARQNRITESRNALITKRMFETNMNKLRNNPEVKAAYDKAWEEEARRRGWKEEAIKRAKIGNSAKPLDLDKFIERNYSDKLQYK